MSIFHASHVSALYVYIPHIEEKSLKKNYFDALYKEIDSCIYPHTRGYSIDSVYLKCQEIGDLDLRVLDTFDKLKNRFPIDGTTEVTIEVGSDNVEPSHLLSWQKSAINRVAVRMTNPYMVSNIGYTMSCYAHLFEHNTLDIYIDSNKSMISKWSTLLPSLALDRIQHIGFYLEEHNQESKVQKVYAIVQDMCNASKLNQYEVYHFARTGHESRYMNVLWERRPYCGFGLAAESFDGARRFKNVQDIKTYIQAVLERGTAYDTHEMLAKEQVILEGLMLGIRRSKGINVDALIANMPTSYQQEMRARLMQLAEHGYVFYKQGVVRLRPKGYAVEQGVLSYLAL